MAGLTIYDIKRLTIKTAPYYFTSNTMKGFGQTLKSFSVSKLKDGKYMISAPIKDRGRIVQGVKSERIFDPKTNKLEFIQKWQNPNK